MRQLSYDNINDIMYFSGYIRFCKIVIIGISVVTVGKSVEVLKYSQNYQKQVLSGKKNNFNI